MKKAWLSIITLAFVFSLISAIGSSPLLAAEELPTITTEELAKGIKDKSLFVVDNNREDIFQKNHIPGAVWMNPSSLDAKQLPSDKNSLLVFYCKNPRCMASHAGAQSALKMGYKNVKVYSSGIDGWIAAGQSTASGK